MDSKKVRISIIIPLYNAEKYIRETIKSILSQDFKDFEIIIINDQSKDNSLKIAKSLEKKDKRIKVLSLGKNSGRAKAVNEGFKIAKGEYITFSDADDLFYPGRLKKQFNFMEKHKDIDLIYGDMILLFENGKKQRRKAVDFKNIQEPLKILKKESKLVNKKYINASEVLHPVDYIPGTSVFFRRKIIDNGIKMDSKMWYEDCDFNCQVIGAGYKIKRIPMITFFYRQHEGQKMKQKDRKAKATKQVIDKLRAGKYFR